MQVAILAGGLATRLRPLTEMIPKSLLEIDGKPFLEYQLDFLRRGGVEDVVLCVGYQGKKIEDYFGDGRRFGVNVRYSYENRELLGTAGALKNAERLLDDKFFVMYGDSYLFLDFSAVMNYFDGFQKLGLMVVYRNYDRYEKSNVWIEDSLVKQYSKEERTGDMIYIDYGASLLRKEVLELVPAKQAYSLEQLFTGLIQRRELLAYEAGERFYQIGSLEGLEEFVRFVSRQEVLP